MVRQVLAPQREIELLQLRMAGQEDLIAEVQKHYRALYSEYEEMEKSVELWRSQARASRRGDKSLQIDVLKKRIAQVRAECDSWRRTYEAREAEISTLRDGIRGAIDRVWIMGISPPMQSELEGLVEYLESL